MRVYYSVLPENEATEPVVKSIVLENEILVGRKQGHLRLEDKLCSRRHAAIFLDGDGQLCIRDLGSRNGTFVNERRVKLAPLAPGKVIRVGHTRLRIVNVAASDMAPQEGALEALNESDAQHMEKLQAGDVVSRGSWPGFFECVPNGNREKFNPYIDE